MDKNLYQENLAKILADVFDTLTKKNADYAGEDGAFSNFEETADMAEVSVEQGLLIRIGDKISRIKTLLKRPRQVRDEKLVDTARDLVGYTAILALWLLETRDEEDDIKEEPKQENNSVAGWFKKIFLPLDK